MRFHAPIADLREEEADSDSSDDTGPATDYDCYGGDTQMELPLSDQLPLFRF